MPHGDETHTRNEDRQEGGDLLREGKCGVGDHTGGVVEKGNQVGFALAPAIGEHAGAVHDVAHPQLPGVLEGKAGEMINAGMAKKGLVSLAWYDGGARSFYNSKKPIKTPADVTGMKIRVMNNDLYSGMISALGGNPSPMAFSEVYQSLKTGVVDGAENNWPSYESTGHYEVAKYYSISQHLIIPETLCINAAVWDTLSAEEQKILKEAAQESALLQRKLWKERSKASEAKVKSGGSVTNTIPDKSAFQAAMKPVYEKFLAENPNLRPLVEMIQNTP